MSQKFRGRKDGESSICAQYRHTCYYLPSLGVASRADSIQAELQQRKRSRMMTFLRWGSVDVEKRKPGRAQTLLRLPKARMALGG
jgi:hypothetical protein